MDIFDQNRRDFLIKALSSGLFATGNLGLSLPAFAMGQVPGELPPGRSIYKLEGSVKINNKLATLESSITPSSTIETAKNSSVIFAVGKDAFILREGGKVELQGSSTIISGLRLVTGKLLSVFGRRDKNKPVQLKTVVAHIGIRGTGVYLESEPDLTYVCTCYGTADISSLNDKKSSETVTTTHHDAPRYIVAGAGTGQGIQQAPVINHTDDELELIESLVGRDVPFAFTSDYSSSRKPRY